VTSGEGEAETTSYFLKRINTGNAANGFRSAWTVDRETNTAYVKSILELDALDARDRKINELGLWLGNEEETASGSVFSDLELATRITFDTESLSGEKEVTVEYYIFV
jgi:hypothetical protein